MVAIKRNHQIKAIFFLLFLANRFQLACKNAATTTRIRARPLIKVSPGDYQPQLGEIAAGKLLTINQ
jgi:hypothetical protein